MPYDVAAQTPSQSPTTATINVSIGYPVFDRKITLAQPPACFVHTASELQIGLTSASASLTITIKSYHGPGHYVTDGSVYVNYSGPEGHWDSNPGGTVEVQDDSGLVAGVILVGLEGFVSAASTARGQVSAAGSWACVPA
jgi:hypothetical protein